MTSAQPKIRLTTLPLDIIQVIVAYLPNAYSIASLGCASRALYAFILSKGWHIFVQSNFPSLYPSIVISHDDTSIIDWLSTARELISLSRNWDRRGFSACYLEPNITVPGASSHHRERRSTETRRGGSDPRRRNINIWSDSLKGRQTVGFHPVLDVHSTLHNETLLVGAGPGLLLRKTDGRQATETERWWAYQDPQQMLPGKDDITAVQICRSQTQKGVQEAIVGRANGALARLCLQTPTPDGCIGTSIISTTFKTDRKSVRSTSMLRGTENALLSAVLDNSTVALYRVPDLISPESSEDTVEPFSELLLSDFEKPWSAGFLSPSTIALGKTSTVPLAVHDISPEGLKKTPTREYRADENSDMKNSSVYATVPLDNQVFLGGWYHGDVLYVWIDANMNFTHLVEHLLIPKSCRLHDLRSPEPYSAKFTDPVDPASAVYSLATVGHERILVGGARHSLLKVFDLRMNGGNVVYDYISASPTGSTLREPSSEKSKATGWATYLSDLRHGGREKESPVYSLTASNFGRRVYAGTEARIWELDFIGMAGPSMPVRSLGRKRMNMTMYEMAGTTRLYKQMHKPAHGPLDGGRLDERWTDRL